jgi:hypothetical protein
MACPVRPAVLDEVAHDGADTQSIDNRVGTAHDGHHRVIVDRPRWHQINTTVTTAVLLIAAVKAYLVIRHFMEVRRAPLWLKATTSGWVLGLFTLLLSFYFASL